MSGAIMTTNSNQIPSREDVEARMDALLARLPARRLHDLDEFEARVRTMGKTEELESLARLAALDARVRAMGDPDDLG